MWLFYLFWPLIASEGYKECRLSVSVPSLYFFTGIVIVVYTQQDADIQDLPEDK